MTITAALVKELRERTSAGMMECKKALVEMGGDIDAAVERMRKTGLAKADKKAGRTAAEGVIVIKTSEDAKRAVMLEVNCETDFVTKGDDFQNFVTAVANTAFDRNPVDIDSLLNTLMDGGDTVANVAKALVVTIGEKINVRRYARLESDDGIVGAYLHGTRIGVLVDISGADAGLAKDVAMHIAATKPVCVSADDVSQQVVEKEKEIFIAQASQSGKSPEIVEKMVTGRINKFLRGITLLGQPFVKDPDQTIEQLLKSAGAIVNSFHRLEVGEGIEKKAENFADEVMAQVKDS